MFGSTLDPVGAMAQAHERVLTHLGRGRSLLRRGEVDAAVAEFSAAVELAPDLGDAYHSRAGAYLAKWELSAALADATRAIDLEPTRQTFWMTRANVHYHLRDPRAADADYQASHRLNPARDVKFVVNYLEGEAADRPDRALRDCANHLNYDPDDFLSYARRGLLLLLLGRDDEAAADFASYARRNSEGVEQLAAYRAEVQRRSKPSNR